LSQIRDVCVDGIGKGGADEDQDRLHRVATSLVVFTEMLLSCANDAGRV
jgi:hypothetical protein